MSQSLQNIRKMGLVFMTLTAVLPIVNIITELKSKRELEPF